LRAIEVIVPLAVGAAVASYARRQALAEREVSKSLERAEHGPPPPGTLRAMTVAAREARFLVRGIVLYLLLLAAIGIALTFWTSLVLGIGLTALLVAWIYFELLGRRWAVVAWTISPPGSGRAWEIRGWIHAIRAVAEVRGVLEAGAEPRLNAKLLAQDFRGPVDDVVEPVTAADGTLWAVRCRLRLPLISDSRWLGIS
jgi:hypothetical protein